MKATVGTRSALMAIGSLWSTTIACIGPMFSRGLMGIVLGCICFPLIVVVDIVATVVGLVILVPILVFELLFTLVLGR